MEQGMEKRVCRRILRCRIAGESIAMQYLPARMAALLMWLGLALVSVSTSVDCFPIRTRATPVWPRSSARLLQRIDTGECSALWTGDHSTQKQRRRFLLTTAIATLAAAPYPVLSQALAATAMSSTPSSSSSLSLMLPEQAVVTHKVFFNVRISRSDGTFYVRDDLPDVVENQVFTGRLVIGLFGKNAPNHVARFLQYVTVDSKPMDDAPLPSYSRSSFTQFDQATGLLLGGTIPSLEVTELQGTSVLKYGGRIFPSKLWIDVATPAAPKLSHVGVGLLTHDQFDVTPAFGMTTRSDSTSLDRTHTVFGRLLPDETSAAFLQRVAELPTYSVDRPVATGDDSSNVNNPLLEEAAGALYTAQRDFFRGAAKSFGDTRISKLYEGKLLRRVEVTQVGVL
jgi:Cyclophilin type peptidyl-prolyl cis-trans isomerase/CLD